MTRVLDPVQYLITRPKGFQIPAGTFFLTRYLSSSSNPVINVADFSVGSVFDVSQWASWRLNMLLSPNSVAPHPTLILIWYADTTLNIVSARQEIPLTPTIAGGGFTLPITLGGRVLAPFLSLGIGPGTVGVTNVSNWHFGVSNRPVRYDGPYTLDMAGSTIASLPIQSVPGGGVVTAELHYYVGPAQLVSWWLQGANMVIDIREATSTKQWFRRWSTVANDATGPLDLWIPPAAFAPLGPQLRIINNTAGALLGEAILIAA